MNVAGKFWKKDCKILSTYADIFSVRHPIPDIIGRNGGKMLCSMAMSMAVYSEIFSFIFISFMIFLHSISVLITSGSL